MGVDEATAADLVQVAWLRLIERYDSVTGHGTVGPWLKQVVRNDARKFHTRAHRPLPAEGRWQSEHQPDEVAIESDECARIRHAFDRLDQRCQDLLHVTLFVDPPLPYDEVAILLTMARGSIGPTRQRCLQRLENLLMNPDSSDTSQRYVSSDVSAASATDGCTTDLPTFGLKADS